MVDHERIIQDHLASIDARQQAGLGLLAVEGDSMTMGVVAAGIAALGVGGWWLSRLITGLDRIVGIVVVVSLLGAVFAAAGGL